ncbi:MAG: response regulator, partial [Rhodocyclaceae bacterium]|nr:response regulator [Rhodocyclaceae bacterium]
FLILVVDDERRIRQVLRATLEAQGYRVAEAETGARALVEAAAHKPDLLLLDLGLPDMDGVAVIAKLRAWSALPVVVLSARTQEEQKIAALDAGADDYVSKPFAAGELLARLRVALRHAARGTAVEVPAAAAELVFGAVRVDLARREVHAPAGGVRLTPIEYKLLAALARCHGMVVTHRKLLQEVWGPGHAEDTHYLRIYMKQLRDKLEPDPLRPRHLLTETGIGYRLRAAPPEEPPR